MRTPVLLLFALAALASPAALAGALSAPSQTPDGLSDSDWQGIRGAYERHRHAVVANEDGTRQARNPGQQWVTRFDGRGFTVKPDGGGWEWGLELTGYGYAGHEIGVAPSAAFKANGQRLECRRDANLMEWFVNDGRGLEQGWTLDERPAGADGRQALRLALAVRGGLAPQVAGDGTAVSFAGVDGGGVEFTALTFGGLKAWDADGRALAAKFEVGAGGLAVAVDDVGARYPVTIDPIAQQAYLKASNTDPHDGFGSSVAVSGDTVVVGADGESSNATGVNGNQANNSATNAGAAYVFVRSGTTWTQQAYLKASDTGALNYFGCSVAVSGDTVVVGADHADAAYVFVRSGTAWSQQAYLRAWNTGERPWFGRSVAISGDTIVVGAHGEDGNATDSGAAYVFVRDSTTWTQQAYLKASYTGGFGWSVAVSGDTVVVGAYEEDGNATGVNGNQADNSASNAGAAYVFVRSGTTWSQQAYLKASNTGAGDSFGMSVAVSGETVVVGASSEDSIATGVDGDQADNSAASGSGAAYVFVRSGTTWSQQAYLKASNTGADNSFGFSVAVSGDTVVVGAYGESSNATGVNGNQADNSATNAGAAYVFTIMYSLTASGDHGAVTGVGDYTPGTTATLTAIPDSGYIFAGWTGDASGTDNPLSVLMDSIKTVGASFGPDLADGDSDGLTNHQEYVVYGTDPGLADTDGDGLNDGQEVQAGRDPLKIETEVILGSLAHVYDGSPKAATATTDPAGLTVNFLYDGMASLPVDAGSCTVTATIDDPTYTGTASGTLVIAKATATVALGDLGHVWDGTPKAATATTTPEGLNVLVTYDGSSMPPTDPGRYEVAAQVDEANYTGGASGTLVILDVFTLAVTGDNGTVTGGGQHVEGTTATLEAGPAPGYVFAAWSGDASGTDNPLSILMDSDKTISATFEPDLADDDNDGLTNYQEIVVLGTNPALADTDDDGRGDAADAFPLNPDEWVDTDGDGTGNNADQDDDDDGVPDADELFEGTNPLLADTDGDGLNDRFELDNPEVVSATDPDTDGNGVPDGLDDPDADGLDNLGEQAAGTSPRLADTDRDGLADGAEVAVHHTNPTAKDTDGDALTDGEEVLKTRTAPLLADSDGDGTPDGEEDSDCDGYTNLAELRLLRTHPGDSTSRFVIRLVVAPDGSTELVFPTVGGPRYVIERSVDLITWQPRDELIGTGSEVRLPFGKVSMSLKYFYRVVVYPN